MADLAPAKRYAITLAVIRQRLSGVVTDDLCDIFCKQMNKVSRAAEAELQQYLNDNQGKTDEILRRYAYLMPYLILPESEDNQLKIIRETVSSRPDLCGVLSFHIEFGGKNECRFYAENIQPSVGLNYYGFCLLSILPQPVRIQVLNVL
ncbi:Transposase and inactivated derivatives, TnpA family [Yersinia ruckeri]|nr:hypothetical protein [Yersinia ruckeri]SUQ37736.1 Transposase and inactivated derivatives, TnpA family [Yersinia ruckeri]